MPAWTLLKNRVGYTGMRRKGSAKATMGYRTGDYVYPADLPRRLLCRVTGTVEGATHGGRFQILTLEPLEGPWLEWPGIGALVRLDDGVRRAETTVHAACQLSSRCRLITSGKGLHAHGAVRNRELTLRNPGGSFPIPPGGRPAPDAPAEVPEAPHAHAGSDPSRTPRG